MLPYIIVLTGWYQSNCAQTIDEVFCRYEFKDEQLTFLIKDSLIRNGVYILPGADSIISERYTYFSDNVFFAELTYDYITGQNGFYKIEIRKYPKTDGDCIFLWSKYGGTKQIFDQLEIFSLTVENGSIKEIASPGYPVTINIRDFLKPSTPDSIVPDIQAKVNTSASLTHEGIEYRITYSVLEDENWIARKNVLYLWNGQFFEKKN